MISEFDSLSNEEQDLMLRAPIITCILIAGADNHIDNKEIKHSLEMARNKHKKFKSSAVGTYYLNVAEDFEDKLKIVLQKYPTDAGRRNTLITEELAQLNKVIPKLPRPFAIDFYRSLRDIAVQIAESSGGLLGMNAVDEDEASLVGLPMINNPDKQK